MNVPEVDRSSLHIPAEVDAHLLVRDAWAQEEQPHRHAEGQFVLVKRGCLSGGADTQQWLLQAGTAVWIPPWHTHWGRGEGRTELAVLYLRPEQCGRLPQDVTPLHASDLARALIERLLEPPHPQTDSQRRARMLDLLLDEISEASADGLVLTLPQDKRLRPIADVLIGDPSQRRTLAEWSRRIGATERTLSRLYKRETGLSYTAWCHRLRLREALRGLAGGVDNTALADRLGFSSPDSFSHWFRQQTRQTPRAVRRAL
jgi:AraC-like DNA-binding protein